MQSGVRLPLPDPRYAVHINFLKRPAKLSATGPLTRWRRRYQRGRQRSVSDASRISPIAVCSALVILHFHIWFDAFRFQPSFVFGS
jgi:hypothetical protein